MHSRKTLCAITTYYKEEYNGIQGYFLITVHFMVGWAWLSYILGNKTFRSKPTNFKIALLISGFILTVEKEST